MFLASIRAQDEILAVNGVSHGGNFDKCRELIVGAGTTLSLTVVRREDGPGESLGALLGSWNVAMGSDGALFVTAHKVETEGFGSRRFGLLLLLQRQVGDGSSQSAHRYAIFVPADELTRVCAEHFGASLLVPSKALELAKLFANLLELRALPATELPPTVAMVPPPELAHSQYVLCASGAAFGWAAPCLDGDSLQVCFQRAAHLRKVQVEAMAAAGGILPTQSPLISGAASETGGATTAAATTTAVVSVRKYTLSVDDLGIVAGVPPDVIKLLPSGAAVGNEGVPGQRVQVDFQVSLRLSNFNKNVDRHASDYSTILTRAQRFSAAFVL